MLQVWNTAHILMSWMYDKYAYNLWLPFFCTICSIINLFRSVIIKSGKLEIQECYDLNLLCFLTLNDYTLTELQLSNGKKEIFKGKLWFVGWWCSFSDENIISKEKHNAQRKTCVCVPFNDNDTQIYTSFWLLFDFQIIIIVATTSI